MSENVDSWILCFSREAGGAEAIAPVVKRLMERYAVVLLAKDYAKDCFTRHSLPFTEINGYSPSLMKELTKKSKPALILTSATSLPWNDMTERYLWKWGEREGVPSVAVVDQWQNYSLRFSGVEKSERLRYLPNYICIMDNYAKTQMIREGIPEGRIFVTGQPAFDRLLKYKGIFDLKRKEEIRKSLGVSKNHIMILFVSEALRRDFGDTLGYTEASTLEAVLDILNRLSDDRHRFTVVVKLHPQNMDDDFGDIKLDKYQSLNIKFVAKEIPPIDLTLSSDVVVGMSSVLLIESIILGKPTLSLQINAKKNDNLIATKIGAIPLITNTEKFEDVLRSILVDKNYLEQYLRVQNKLFADGGATERIVSFVDKILERKV